MRTSTIIETAERGESEDEFGLELRAAYAVLLEVLSRKAGRRKNGLPKRNRVGGIEVVFSDDRQTATATYLGKD
jgi:hypothetical protein